MWEKNSFIPADEKGRLTLMMNPGEVCFLIPHDGRNIVRREKAVLKEAAFVPRNCFRRGMLGVTEYAKSCCRIDGIPGDWRIEAASGALLRSGHSSLKEMEFRKRFVFSRDGRSTGGHHSGESCAEGLYYFILAVLPSGCPGFIGLFSLRRSEHFNFF